MAPTDQLTGTGTGRGAGLTMGLVAGAVAAADLLSKLLAVRQLGAGGDVPLGATFRLVLLYNHELAWGLTGTGAAFGLTVAATLLLLGCVVAVARPLAAVDPAAPRMLGLIVGAALGNAASLLAYPAGAPDFIAVDWGRGSESVFNVADVALFFGVALCARSAWRVALAVRDERVRDRAPARHPAFAVAAAVARRETPRARIVEREIPLAVAREPAPGTPLGDAPATRPPLGDVAPTRRVDR